MYWHRVPSQENTQQGLLPFTWREVPRMKRNGRQIVDVSKQLSGKHYGGESAPVGWSRICVHCGRGYVPKNKQQKVCYSVECREWIKRSYDSSAPEERICVICARSFIIAKKATKACCGPECAKALANQTRGGKKHIVRFNESWDDPFQTMNTYNTEVASWLDSRMCPMG